MTNTARSSFPQAHTPSFSSRSSTASVGGRCSTDMLAISANRRAVREALAHEGWRFALVGSTEELKRHRQSCRTLTLPVGSDSDNRSRTIREVLLRQLPW